VRPVLVAYNLWLTAPIDEAIRIATAVRNENIRTLGLQVGEFTQVSVNLVAPEVAGPHHVYDAVANYTAIHHAELVGLIPARALAPIPRERWGELDVSPEQTIEWQLARRNERLRNND
jgi:glutamate formiminotransferase